MISLVGLVILASAEIRDHYRTFADLQKSEREGIDFRVTARKIKSPVCVLAIHGGKIEDGTEQLARMIAGEDLSLYVFEATKPRANMDLHLTSTHFDDPRALEIASSARRCVSLHAFKEEDRDVACVGGGNIPFRDWIVNRLKTSGIDVTVESPCARFGGATPANITNRAAEGGVQIELSTHLRQRVLRDSALLRKLGGVLRAAALDFKVTP